MKILALDSSGLVASVAVVEDGTLVAEYTTNFKKTHSQTLLPMLDELASRIDLDMESVDAIAVSAGPGSFTGLRIGSATAKGLGLALQKPIISVPTLELLAFNFFDTDAVICPMMDARRSQVYTGLYRMSGNEPEIVMEQAPMPIAEIIEKLNTLGEKVILLGDGVPAYRTQLESDLKVAWKEAPAHLSRQRAGALGTLASIMYAKGICESAREHKPIYLRLSQAERERAEREKAAKEEEKA